MDTKERIKSGRSQIRQQQGPINTFCPLHMGLSSFPKPVQANYRHRCHIVPPSVKHSIFYFDITPSFGY